MIFLHYYYFLFVFFFFFFFNDTATTEIYTLSLHDALPIRAMPSTIGEYPAQSAPPLSESGHRAIPAATYAHALPGTPLGRDDLAEGRLYFSGLVVLDHPPIAGFATVRPEHGPAEVRAGVRQLVTRVVTAVCPVERKPAVVSRPLLGCSRRG